MLNRNNKRLNADIEIFIAMYSGTAIGQAVKNAYENGTDYEGICDIAGIDYSDYEDFADE